MISAVFVDRPRLAIVISILITLAGLIALAAIPIAQFPDIVPPEVSVTTTYPGANAEVVEQTVAQVIEREINGVSDMLYMRSFSGNDGSYSLTVSFAVGDRSRNQHRQCPEPGAAGDGAPAGRGAAIRRQGRKEILGDPAGGGAALAQGDARQPVFVELPADQHPRRDQPHPRRRPGQLVWPAGLCDAHLARHGPADRARADPAGRDRGGARAERPGRGRPHRRRAGRRSAAADDPADHPGPARHPRAVRRDHRARPAERLADPGARRGASRARRAIRRCVLDL